jgi:NitT/TauT family transport system ATP-binding protein
MDIKVRGLNVTFTGGAGALRDVDLDLRAGEFVSLIGPNGCGKSTLLRVIAGLLAPSTGDVQVGGESPQTATRQHRGISFVFQEPTLLPWRIAADNVRLPLELQRVPRPDREARVRAALDSVDLNIADARKFPGQLSGGLRMRVALARALVTRPGLLLLDEPFSATDELQRQGLHEQLLHLWDVEHWTALFVTHSIPEAVLLGQRVLVMGPSPGRVLAEFPVPFAYPRSHELLASAEFAALAGRVRSALREAWT